uniref:Phosphoglycerate mutase n=1 Tax=Globodera rostochiensis TaxID=31243 RepID=A0A914ICL8_GLORO
MLDAIKFMQCQEQYYKKHYKIDEQKQLSWILKQKDCIEGDLFDFFREFEKKICAQNQTLMEAKKVAYAESKELSGRFDKKEIESIQLYHPYQKFNVISMILRAQNATIGRYFLDKFLKGNDENQRQLGKIIKKLKTNDDKMFDFFTTAEFLYTYENYTDSLQFIEDELNNLQIVWTDVEKEKVNRLWTIDQRPNALQTLYFVRHAQRQDNDVPLSTRGLEQAEELGKWFKPIPIDNIYTSPFTRTVQTANGILHGRNGSGIYMNIEPGLTEFFKPCEQRMEFFENAKLYADFPLSNPNYWPVFNKRALLASILERQSLAPKLLEKDCNFVVEQTLRHILETNKNSKHIVLVSHSGIIGLLHELLTGEWVGPGQATVSKFVRYDDGDGGEHTVDVLKRFRMEYSSGLSHLSEHHYLRPH